MKIFADVNMEISLALARVLKVAHTKKGPILDFLDTEFSKEEMIFNPRLVFGVACGSKGINQKVRNIAVLIQIMYLSTKIHSQVIEKTEKNEEHLKKVQLPILAGDFLYGKIYALLCSEDCLEYFDDFTDYIANLNLGWVKYLENTISKNQLVELWYGNLSSIACRLGAEASEANPYWVKICEQFGYLMGKLLGVKTLNLSKVIINETLEDLQNLFAVIPMGRGKKSLIYCMDSLCKENDIHFSYGQPDVFLVAES